jgi:hypothetical protein
LRLAAAWLLSPKEFFWAALNAVQIAEELLK